jgi:hypothetical protein
MIFQPMTKARFIEIAKAIHGDLYDYSETVLIGSQHPISFKCNRCRTIRTLSQAQCHIRKNRPCGCKPCNHERMSRCKGCGSDVSSKVYYRQGFRCVKCYKDRQWSLSDEWALLAKSEIHRVCKKLSVWDIKCKSAMVSNSTRTLGRNKKQEMIPDSWKETIERQIRRCLWDQNVLAWERKCKAAFKGLRKRKLK